MPILVVGSIALDTIKSPYGKLDRDLGGSATFFSLAASYFTQSEWWVKTSPKPMKRY